MTKRIPSYVEYEGYKYTLIHNTSKVWILDMVGVKPNVSSMAGNYSVTYIVEDNHFLLKDLHLWHVVTREELNKMPGINSIRPEGQFGNSSKTGWVHYNNVHFLTPFSGYITFGGKTHSMYESSRLPPRPRDFEVVLRLKLSMGTVELIEDMSENARAIHDAVIAEKKEFEALHEADSTISYGAFLASKGSDLYDEERCIEDPSECGK